MSQQDWQGFVLVMVFAGATTAEGEEAKGIRKEPPPPSQMCLTYKCHQGFVETALSRVPRPTPELCQCAFLALQTTAS